LSYPAVEHPLAKELVVMARRAEPDLVLKARYLGFRKELLGVVAKRVPGLVVKLVAGELARVAETVLTESRQWREAQAWEDHCRHLQGMRAAASFHLWLGTEGLKIARANDSSLGSAHVRQFDPTWDG
jgi:hypothetical protein